MSNPALSPEKSLLEKNSDQQKKFNQELTSNLQNEIASSSTTNNITIHQYQHMRRNDDAIPYAQLNQEQQNRYIIDLARYNRQLNKNKFIEELKKCVNIPLCGFITFILTLLAITAVLIQTNVQCWFSQSCIIDDKLLVNYRLRFQSGKCAAYQIIDTMDVMNVTITQKYLSIFCVNKAQNDIIQFIASFQKTSDYSSQHQEQTIYPPPYMDRALFEAGTKGEPPIEDNTIVYPEESIYTYDDQTNTSGSVIPVFYYPLVRFTALMNGTRHPTLNWISFPIVIDTQLKGKIKHFIDAFLPLVDKDLYTSSDEQKSTKKNEHHRLLQQMQNTSGGVNGEASVYEYQYDINGMTNLSSQHGMATSSDRQNTNTELSKSSSFDLDANMLESKIAGTTNFQPQTLQQSAQYQTQDLKQTAVTCKAEIKMNFKFQRIAERQRIDNLIRLTTLNRTQNYTFQKFDEHQDTIKIDGAAPIDQQSQNNPSGRNLQSYQNLTHRIFRKENILKKNNAFGVSLKVTVYSQTHVYFNKISNQSGQINILLNVNMGLLVQVGGRKISYSLMKLKDQNFSSLSLGYTKQVIVKTMSDLQPSFIKLTNYTFYKLATGISYNLYLYNVQKLRNLTSQIVKKIQEQINSMKLDQIIQKIMELVRDAKDTITSKIIDGILNVKNVFINNVITGIENYIQTHFNSAINKFNKFIDNIKFHQDNTQRIIGTTQEQYKKWNEIIFKTVQDLISHELNQTYNKQMKKAQPITTFIEWVKQNIFYYQNVFVNNTIKHIENFELAHQKTHEDYLNVSKVNHTQIYEKNITNYTDSFNPEYRRLRLFFQQFQSIIDKKIMDSFLSIIQGELNAFNTKIEQINTQLQIGIDASWGIYHNKGGLCCQQNFWGTCVHRNPARFQMEQQPNIYRNLLYAAKMSINATYTIVSRYINGVQQLIDDQNKTVKQKYQSYQLLQQNLVINDLTQPINQFQKRIDKSYWYLSVICRESPDPIWGYINQLNAIIAKMNQLIKKNQNLRAKADAFNLQFSFNDYLTLLDVIEVSPFITWLNDTINTAAYQAHQVFYNLYEYYKSYSMQSFLFSENKIIDKYLAFFQDMKKRINFFCLSSMQINEFINNATEHLHEKLFVLTNFNKTKQKKYFDKQIEDFIPIMKGNISHVFVEYLSIPVCRNSKYVMHYLNTTSDVLMKEFNTIQKVYESLRKIYKQKTQQFQKIAAVSLTFFKKFYTLRKLDQYLRHIQKIYNYSIQVKDIYKYSIERTNELKDLYATRQLQLNYTQYITNTNKMVEYIRNFNQTTFSLHFSKVFTDAQNKRDIAIITAHNLSYQIIQLVVTARMIKQAIQSSLEQMPKGLSKYKNLVDNNFKNLSSLKQNFTEKELEYIIQNFTQLVQMTNITVFPFMQNEEDLIPDLVERFSECSIINLEYKQVYDRNYDIFLKDVNNYTVWKNQLYKSIQSKIESLIEQLNSLQMAGLSRIKALGEKIHAIFTGFNKILTYETDKLNTLKQQIYDDFEKLFVIDEIVTNISKNIQNQYNKMISNINKQINNTFSNLDETFFDNFKKNQLYTNIHDLPILIQANFTQVDQDVSIITQQMRFCLNSLSKQFIDKLLSLNRMRNNLRDIEISINQKLQQINLTIEDIRTRVSNIKQFIFDQLTKQLYRIFDLVQSLENNFNKIMDEDFKSIQNLYNQKISDSLDFIRMDLEDIIPMYKELDQYRIRSLDNLYIDKHLMNMYKDSILFNKIKTLKKGKLYIEGLTTAFQDIQYKDIIYGNNEKIIKRPIFIQIPLTFPMGVFLSTFEIKIQGVSNYHINLLNYRNISCALNSTLNISLKTNFVKDIPRCVRITKIIHGPFFDGQFSKKVDLVKVIPMRMIQQIKGMKQIRTLNTLSVNNNLNFTSNPTTMYHLQRFDHYKLKIDWGLIIFWIILTLFTLMINIPYIIAVAFVLASFLITLTPIVVVFGAMYTVKETSATYEYFQF